MEQLTQSLDELYANLTIEDEEDGGIIIRNEEIKSCKESFVLVGRFITEKIINFNAMQIVLASLWRAKEGVDIHDIGDLALLVCILSSYGCLDSDRRRSFVV